ncbi:MAG: response regulator [Nitrospiraceae bacterium]|jgi:DNA-binding NtrC family response regulator|nr:response regulator [Nitrospiraceae bacterium]
MAHILVLDDVFDAVEMIKKILGRKGHHVVGFVDEDEALAYVMANPVDLAILDIKLRKLTGVEVLEELRSIRPELRVIMLTGYPTLETAREAVRLGASEYCVKPIEKEELEQKVESVLAG